MSTTRPDVNEILSAIRGATKRVTVAKRTVAEVLVAAPGHLTAEEITQEVQSRHPEVSPSTVYRILEEFEDLQIVVHAHLDQHAAGTASVTALAEEVRGLGSNRDSSPNISPGPCTDTSRATSAARRSRSRPPTSTC